MLVRVLGVAILSLLLHTACAGRVWSAIVVFNDQAQFIAATTGPIFTTNLLNFDAATLPTTIADNSTFQNVLFRQSQDFLGTNLVITDGTQTGTFIGPQLPTTSGTRFLGNTGNAQLVAGRHSFSMLFDSNSRVGALGLSIIASGTPANLGINSGEIRISINGGANVASLNTSLIQQTLAAGTANESQVFFLGLYNDAGLLGDVLVSTTGLVGAFRFRLDDIRVVTAVPEPSTLASLCLLGTLFSLRQLRRRRALIEPQALDVGDCQRV